MSARLGRPRGRIVQRRPWVAVASSPAASGPNSVTGTASASLGALTVSAAGTRTARGSAAAALGGLTVSASGTRRTTGQVSVTLGGLSATAAGVRRTTGQADVLLGGLAVSATGIRRTAGQASVALGGLSVTAAGVRTHNVSGTATVALGSLVVTSSGLQTGAITGTATVALGALSVSARAVMRLTGSATVTLGGLTSRARTIGLITGSAVVTLGGLAVSVRGRHHTPLQGNPYYVREHQHWAVEQERMRHNQALYQVGEYTAFFLMWHEIDFEAGLVARCPRCYAAGKTQRIAAVYNQPTQARCPSCFGTTFSGGIRARIVRPALYIDVDETERTEAKGSQHPANLTVESTVDFRLREGDYAVRPDGSRWRCATPVRTNLRTGFGHPDQVTDAISYNAAPCALEDKTSVAYLLPAPDLRPTLTRQLHTPVDFSDWEQIAGVLLPPGLIS